MVLGKVSGVLDAGVNWIAATTGHQIVAGVVALGVVGGAGYGTYSVVSDGGDSDRPVAVSSTEPTVSVQGDNGSKVVTGGGESNAKADSTELPVPKPVPLFIPSEQAKPENLPDPVRDVPDDIVDQGNHKGQEKVSRWTPGEGADKVNTAPRPAAAAVPKAPAKTPAAPKKPAGGEHKPAAPAAPKKTQAEVDPALANTIQVGMNRFPVLPSGDEGGVFTPPENPALVGWYQNSAEPGTTEQGSVVMSSHIDYAGVDGVGKQFTALEPGDTIVTWNTDGKKTTWKVSKKYLGDKTGKMPGVVQQATGPQKLVLVTCGGRYVGPPLYYADNVFVEADPVV